MGRFHMPSFFAVGTEGVGVSAVGLAGLGRGFGRIRFGLVGEEGSGWVGGWGEGRGIFDEFGSESLGGEVVTEEKGGTYRGEG